MSPSLVIHTDHILPIWQIDAEHRAGGFHNVDYLNPYEPSADPYKPLRRPAELVFMTGW